MQTPLTEKSKLFILEPQTEEKYAIELVHE